MRRPEIQSSNQNKRSTFLPFLFQFILISHQSIPFLTKLYYKLILIQKTIVLIIIKMNQSLPFIPGYSFRDLTKTNHGYPRTLVYSKGVPVPQPLATSTSTRALELLDAQNKVLDREKAAELTYGPKRAAAGEIKLPRYLAMDKKVLRFDGWFREEIDDWSMESYRIRRVTVLYYLQNDTMEVIEPKTPNSGLLQGTLFKRHAFPHPNGRGRRYLWKDLNLGSDLQIYGICIRLADCDQWTREYLINAGLELRDSEAIPPDPYELQKRSMMARNEAKGKSLQDHKLLKFLTSDRKVLRFYGTWKDILSEPPEMRRVILQYYLVDDTLELLEDHAPNCGRMPLKVLVKRQKVAKDRNELPESFPSAYLEVKDEDDLEWFHPKDFRTGKDIVVWGKKIFLYDCDEFTRHHYKVHFNVDYMESIGVIEKPKPQAQKILPPHTGIGDWNDSLQNCLSLVPKPPKKDFMKEMIFDGVTLRYKAELVTPIAHDKHRQFVISFYPSDDTVAINEDFIPNSGFPGGPFLKRNKLLKPESSLSTNPIYYEARDFYIGSEIRACGKLFQLKDADRFVLTFMQQHPEIYTEEQIYRQKRNSTEEKLKSDILQKEKCDLMQSIRVEVLKRFGALPYPLPSCLEPACDLQFRDNLNEELYSANMPIPMDYLRKVVDICTDHNSRTDMTEVRKILLPALGHHL